VSGIEPLTGRLQEARLTAPRALPALTHQRRDQKALNALTVAVRSFRYPFHAKPGARRYLRDSPYHRAWA
jgi:hypothetical protein